MARPDDRAQSLRLAALGRRLRAIRRERGMTAEAFGASLGFDRNYWGRIERGEQNLSFSTLSAIADGVGQDLGELLGRLDEDARDGAGADRGGSAP